MTTTDTEYRTLLADAYRGELQPGADRRPGRCPRLRPGVRGPEVAAA